MMRFLLRWHRPLAALLALSPPVGSAWYADMFDRWDLFERTGSITAAVGLGLASRRYLQHGIAELASLHAAPKPALDAAEEIHSNKLGLALSALGMVISGWGRYLGWWCFAFIALWAAMALRDLRRDLRHRRNSASESQGKPVIARRE